jgi:hypothetical protein
MARVGLRVLICVAGVEYGVAVTGDANVTLYLTSGVDGRLGLNRFN